MSRVSTTTGQKVLVEGPTRGVESQHSLHRVPLSELIIKAYPDPLFREVLKKIILGQDPKNIPQFWSAVGDILGSTHTNRFDIAVAVSREILNYNNEKGITPKIAPLPEVVGRFILTCKPEEALQQLSFFWTQFAVRPLDVLTTPQVLQSGCGDIFAQYIEKDYSKLIKDPANYAAIASICSHLALQRTPAALWLCDFVRHRYARSSKLVLPEAKQEADFLWKLRDAITARLFESASACELNFKLTLLYPLDVPHPCLDRPVYRFLKSERWILKNPYWLDKVFGEGASLAFKKKQLSAASFMLPAKDKLHHGTLSGGKLIQDPPRSWVNVADAERFQQQRLRSEILKLSAAVGASSDLLTVSSARDELHKLVRTHPYGLAEAVRSCRDLNPSFMVLLDEVFEKRLREAEAEPNREVKDEAMCQAVVLKASIRKGYEQLVSCSTRQFEHALQGAGEQELESARVQAILATLKYLCIVTPVLEQSSSRLLQKFPATFGGSLVARYLSAVRCSDSSVRELILMQAGRKDLASISWLNYAHAAIQVVQDPAELVPIRAAFRRSHRDFVGEWAETNAQAQTSLRMVRMALFPVCKDELNSSHSGFNGLLQSRTERTIKRVLGDAFVDFVESGGVPGAPAIDAAMRVMGYPGNPVIVFVDGERFHSVNRRFSERGFDGHTCSVNWNFTHAGYPVLRIPNHFGDNSKHPDLIWAVKTARSILLGATPDYPNLVEVDPPHDFKPDGSRVILYTPRQELAEQMQQPLRDR